MTSRTYCYPTTGGWRGRQRAGYAIRDAAAHALYDLEQVRQEVSAAIISILRRGLEIVARRAAVPASSERNPRKVAVKSAAIDWAAVPRLNRSQFGDRTAGIQRHVVTVDAVADQRVCDSSRSGQTGQPNPQVPVRAGAQRRVERVGREHITTNDDA